MSVLNRPKIEVYIGITGSGKGVSVNAALSDQKPARLLIWDPRNEYGKWAPRYESPSVLLGAFKHAKGGPVRARYVAHSRATLDEQFAFVCDLAFKAGNLVFAAEELSDVTRASYAPASWKRICTQGRHQGLRVLAMAQRPALMDKTVFGQATYIRCFMLGYEEDRKAMAAEMDAPREVLASLRTSERVQGQMIHTEVQYIERFKREGVTSPVQSIHLKRKGDPAEIAELLARQARIAAVAAPQPAAKRRKAT